MLQATRYVKKPNCRPFEIKETIAHLYFKCMTQTRVLAIMIRFSME